MLHQNACFYIYYIDDSHDDDDDANHHNNNKPEEPCIYLIAIYNLCNLQLTLHFPPIPFSSFRFFIFSSTTPLSFYLPNYLILHHEQKQPLASNL